MSGPPMGPPAGTTIVYTAKKYAGLQAIVQGFVKYYFTKSIYGTAVFTGTLTSLVFAGSYVLKSGGGVYDFNYTIAVPGPTAGAGLGSLAAVIAGWVLIQFFSGRRRSAEYLP